MTSTTFTIRSAGANVMCAFPFDRSLLDAFKRLVPPSDRRWDDKLKAWWIDPRYIDGVTALAQRYGYIVDRDLTNLDLSGSHVMRAVFRVCYIGGVKDRGNGVQTASGMDDSGKWFYTLPYDVLQEWFGVRADPSLARTLYGVLGAKRTDDADALKRAYRRMARQWHPDVCHERGATEIFQAINDAWATLGDTNKRQMYDFGLELEGETEKQSAPQSLWNPPLRCGDIEADAVQRVGGIQIMKIYGWNDIVNASGQVMVASWTPGATGPTFSWR